MLKSSFEKWLVTVTMLIVIAGAVLHFAKSRRVAHPQKPARASVESAPSASSEFGNGSFHPYYVPSVPRPAKVTPKPNAGFEKLPREKVEAWLAKHHRDATSLIAAFCATGDTNYLNEAATNFPNNPRVELAVLARNEFPTNRRKWLDLFKASSPSNSLANYLSAQDYLKNGNTGAAIRELQVASDKSQFKTYAVESQLDVEKLAQFCGKSPLEADNMAMTGSTEDTMPELVTYKRLARGIAALEQQHLNSGDAGSAANLAEMGMILGERLKSGDSGKYIINQLVGIAIDALVLQYLNPDTRYDFLGGKTPSQVMQENKQQSKAFIPTVTEFNAILPSLTDDEKADYFKREQIYGEVKAEKWAIQQQSQGNP